MPDRLTRKTVRSKKRVEGAGTVGRDGSTQGDRLAWLLSNDATPPLSRWIHRLLPSFPLHAQTNMGVWESALDGTAMTEIGHKRAPPRDHPEAQVTNLQWLPGDKRLSFICDEALYTIAVP